MLIYWLLFALFVVPSLAVMPRGPRQKAGLMFPVAGLLLTFVIGLRYRVGADWEPYLYLFNLVRMSSWTSLLDRGDIGFYTLMWAVERAGLGMWAVNLVCAAVFVIGLFRFARQQQSPWLTVAVAIPYLAIVVAMSATRQATAIGFIFLAIVAFTDNKLWRAGLWIFLASLFHASSILMLGIAALSYTRNRFQSILLVLIMAIPAYYLLSSNLETYFERYSGGDLQSSGAAIRVLMNFVPAIIYMLFARHFHDPPNIRAFWRNLSWLALACVPMLFLLPSSTAVDRLALYAIPLQMYVLGRLPAAIDPTLRTYRTWALAIIAYLLLVQFVFLTYSSHREFWDPYQVYPVFESGADAPRVRR